MSRYRDGRQRYSPVSSTRLRSVKRRLPKARSVEPLPRNGASMTGTSCPASASVSVTSPCAGQDELFAHERQLLHDLVFLRG